MKNEDKREAGNNTDAQDQWQNFEHSGDWQLAESEAEDTAELFVSYQADAENQPLYAAGDNPKDEDDDSDDNNEGDDSENEEDIPLNDWGHTDPLDDNSPFPDSNDPSGPGSAV